MDKKAFMEFISSLNLHEMRLAREVIFHLVKTGFLPRDNELSKELHLCDPFDTKDQATEIIKNSPIHIVMVETKEINPNFYILTIEFMDNKNKTTMKTQLEEKHLLSLGFTKL